MGRSVISHEARLGDKLFVMVIGRQLGSVDNTISDNVGAPASPKASHSFLLNDFSIAVHSAIVLLHSLSALVLQSNLDHISGVGDCNANGSGYKCSAYLLVECWVSTFRKVAYNPVSYVHVGAHTYSTK